MTYNPSSGFSDFTGNAGKFTRVNATEDGLEAVALTGGGDMVGSNNLSDLANAATARTNLGVKTAAEIMLMIYPVGSIFVTTVNTNPGAIFGGTWAAFGAGKTLIGVDSGDADFDTVEETGGAKTKAISAHAGTAVADHAAHTHSVTSNVAVGNHASHTHTYTEVPNHVHNLGQLRSATTGAASTNIALANDASSTKGTGAGYETDNPNGGVATATTNGPNAALTHSVTNNAVTSGNPSATLSHTVTQPNDHAALNVVQPYITTYFFKRTS